MAVDDLYRLLVDVPDRPGIVAAVSGFLAERGANILEFDSHSTERHGGTFHARVEFQEPVGGGGEQEIAQAFEQLVATPLAVRHWELWPLARRKRICVLVSREGHCLADLLARWHAGELDGDIGLVISNHEDLRGEVERFGVPFLHVPVEPGGKAQSEARILEAVAGRFDLLVLARYMQILSGDFLERAGAPVINIHHSFLPAFAGADPYARARERGVKIIGATAHYVTEELDAGPIIEQDVERVNDHATAEQMARLGRDIERTVLARAVEWHLQGRVVVDGTRTVVFT
ncbi:unannotated protein [freshwater metagenome]|uniref:Unannotated protein n=1 Tax=freshwater metagenome TaxID=449393 RepID=A0A6J7HIF3_9ZZZZ|nr:formyltetrahydrofolate deformylase [Actinomycetota bacterium]